MRQPRGKGSSAPSSALPAALRFDELGGKLIEKKISGGETPLGRTSASSPARRWTSFAMAASTSRTPSWPNSTTWLPPHAQSEALRAETWMPCNTSSMDHIPHQPAHREFETQRRAFGLVWRLAASRSWSFLLLRRPLIPPLPGGGGEASPVGSKPGICSLARCSRWRFSIR